MSPADRILLVVGFLAWMALFVAIVIGETGSEPLFRRRRRK